MSGTTRIRRHLEGVRAAIEASGVLRLPGGNTLEQALALIDAGDAAAALRVLQSVGGNGAFPETAGILEALLQDAQGNEEAATAALHRTMTESEPGYDVLCLAGDFYRDRRMPEEAAEAYGRAIALAPHASHAFLRRGLAWSDAGDVTRAIDDLRRATLLQPSLGDAHRALGDELRDASMLEAAIASYRRALELDPADEAAQTALDAAIASMVPHWHAAMLNDARRNDAFEAAIRRAVERYAAAHGGNADTMQVLDIGTGTGLLAMMAVRAGAGHVTACEAVGPLAEVAQEIVTRNGMADRINIVHKRSSELAVGPDLPRPADLLTAEIVDAGLLGERILPTIADARARLLAPGAAILPCAATVFAIPFESANLAAERRVDRAAGFDIAPFNRLTPKHYLQQDLAGYDWRPLAPPVDLFRFDFTRNGQAEEEMSVLLTPSSDGTAHGIAVWFRLDLDEENSISTGPMDPPTHWKQAVYAVEPPVDLKQNEPVRLGARHNGHRIRVTLSAR